MTELALLWVAAITGVIGAIGSTALGVHAALSAWKRSRMAIEDQLRIVGYQDRSTVLHAVVIYRPRQVTEAVHVTLKPVRRRQRLALWTGQVTPAEPPVEFLKTADDDVYLPMSRSEGVDGLRAYFTVWPTTVLLDVSVWPESRRVRRPLARRKIWATRID